MFFGRRATMIQADVDPDLTGSFVSFPVGNTHHFWSDHTQKWVQKT
jgi:hypothetical protein